MNEFCSKWADHAPELCGTMPRPITPMMRARRKAGLTMERCGKSLLGGAPLGEQAQSPPEESLCGEEEDLVTSVMNEAPTPGPGMDAGLQLWEQHCRTVGRNRCRAYVEAFSLALAQLAAWGRVFPAVAEEKFREVRGTGVSPEAREMVGYYTAGYAAFLRDVIAIADKAASR